MATLLFSLVGIAGLMGTGLWLDRYRERPGGTAHGQAVIIAIGLAVTWLAAILAPILVSSRGHPGREAIIFAFVFSVSTGVIAYPTVRLLLRLKKKRPQ